MEDNMKLKKWFLSVEDPRNFILFIRRRNEKSAREI
jgi:hypothetical protein